MSQREEAWITPLNLIQHIEHFRSFDQIESLTLSYFSCQVFDHITLQLLFQSLIPTVRKLCLHHPIACPASLLRFILIFTNLQETMICAPRWEPMPRRDDYAATSGVLHGELRLSDLEEGSGPFLSLLGSQTMKYERITLERCGLRDFLPLQRLVSSAGMSLRKLYFIAEGNRAFPRQLESAGFKGRSR